MGPGWLSLGPYFPSSPPCPRAAATWLLFSSSNTPVRPLPGLCLARVISSAQSPPPRPGLPPLPPLAQQSFTFWLWVNSKAALR